jgi:hypothetical protein
MDLAAIPTGNAAIVELAEALGRVRALDERESRMLERAINRDSGAFRRWTPTDDAKLLKMHKARIRVSEMTNVLNRSEQSIFTRLRDLKKAKRYG